uniref:Solute carrier family 13 member 4 n=1 Tax=Cairina moschata TaxID=8855 RepID=A0A8C3CQI3_CAIMO
MSPMNTFTIGGMTATCNLSAFSLQEASCAYVLIVTAVYWVSEAVPLGAAALIPAFLYPLFGVMKSSEVAAEYFKNTTLLLMGVICVAASVEKWNLHKRIALRMVMMAGAQILVLSPQLSEPDLSTKYRYQSRHDHMVCKCLSLSISYAATIGGLTTIIGTSTSLIFLEHFNNHYPNAEVVNFGTWFLFSFPISLIMLVLTWFWMHWLFLGCNFKETCSVSKKKKTKREEMSEKRIQEEYKKLGNVSYPEMVTGFLFILMTLLWFTREPGFVPGWSSFFENTTQQLLALERSTDINALDPIITWKDFQKTMPWEIVVLVGGGYALAAGCKTSGLSTWIGRQMLSLSSLPYWAVTLLACILVSLVTEFVSNPATITIFLPILCSMSETLLINPLYTLIPVTMCISFAVMLPVGNPPNAIVFSYGHCQIKDMVKAGLGVNLIGLAVVMVAINTWGIRLFQLNTFPEWAAVSNITSQI